MRITTSSIIRNYTTGLGQASKKLNDSRMKVITNRKFNKMSEDPGGAVKTFQLHEFFRETDRERDTRPTLVDVHGVAVAQYAGDLLVVPQNLPARPRQRQQAFAFTVFVHRVDNMHGIEITLVLVDEGARVI